MVGQIIYLSRAKYPMGHETDFQILDIARNRNAKLRLTGYLFRSKTGFLQLLEGDAARVETVMNAIRRDPLHTITTELPMRRVGFRAFAKWNMGFGPLDRRDINKVLENAETTEAVYEGFVATLRDAARKGGPDWESRLRNKKR